MIALWLGIGLFGVFLLFFYSRFHCLVFKWSLRTVFKLALLIVTGPLGFLAIVIAIYRRHKKLL